MEDVPVSGNNCLHGRRNAAEIPLMERNFIALIMNLLVVSFCDTRLRYVYNLSVFDMLFIACHCYRTEHALGIVR